jgi:hypothetical protein
MNSLSLNFGSKPEHPDNAVGISFVSSPTLTPDLTISCFDIYRFAKENVSQVQDYVYHLVSPNKTFKVKHVFNGSSVLGQTSNNSSWTIFDTNFSINLESTAYTLPFLNSPIISQGIFKSRANSWGVQIKDGIVFRSYTIPDYEQSNVWFQTNSLSGLLPKGTSCILAYTIPELKYKTLVDSTFTDSSFPGTGVKLKSNTETAHPSSPTRISYLGEAIAITSIKVNGSSIFDDVCSATFNSSGIIKEFNKDSKYIDLKINLNPEDEVELSYLEYNDTYRYFGYRTRNNVFYPFDCNPEFAHVIGDERYGALRSASDCLLEEVTIYALPSAVGVYSLDTSTNPNTLTLTWYSALDFGESHFIRHTVGSPTEDIISRTSEGPINTFGYAVFGRNFYDEAGVPKRDIFSTSIPSMLPLARMLIKAPASVNSVVVADSRIRGGGIPETFNFANLVYEPDALDIVRGYYDTGNWNGKATQVGGTTEISIVKSVLKSNGGKFLEKEVREVIESNIPPGIDYVLLFVDSV